MEEAGFGRGGSNEVCGNGGEWRVVWRVVCARRVEGKAMEDGGCFTESGEWDGGSVMRRGWLGGVTCKIIPDS